MKWFALVVMALFPLMGCAPFESYKELNSQNKQIGDAVKAKGQAAGDAELTQMGDDVAQNSQTLEDVLDLKPETATPYSPANSAALRKQAVTDFSSPWYKKLWVWLTGAGSVLLTLLIAFLKKGSSSSPVVSLAEDGVAALLDLYQQHAGKDGTPPTAASLLTKDSLAKIIGDLRADAKYGHLVDEILAKYHLDAAFPKTEPLT